MEQLMGLPSTNNVAASNSLVENDQILFNFLKFVYKIYRDINRRKAGDSYDSSSFIRGERRATVARFSRRRIPQTILRFF